MHGEKALRHAGRGAAPSPIWNSWGAGPKSALMGKNLTSSAAAALQRRLDEKVEQLDRVASGAPRHEAAAAGRGEHRLGDEGMHVPAMAASKALPPSARIRSPRTQ